MSISILPTKAFRPMLAIGQPNDWTTDQFYEYIDKNIPKPWGITPKIDGIRCVTREVGVDVDAFCRSMKPVPNWFVRTQVRLLGPDLDGELTCGNNFQAVTSGIMSHEGEPDFTYHIFDTISVNTKMSYFDRVNLLCNKIWPNIPCLRINLLAPFWVNSIDDMIGTKTEFMRQGAEGAILRPYMSPYKQGRSTLKEGWMIKLKDFEDAEATVIGFNEEMQNLNAPEQSELDYKVRSTHQENMKGKGRLGSLRVRDEEGREFNVGTGFTADQRVHMWMAQATLIGRKIKFKYQRHGTKDAPRIPVFLGFRDARDL